MEQSLRKSSWRLTLGILLLVFIASSLSPAEKLKLSSQKRNALASRRALSAAIAAQNPSFSQVPIATRNVRYTPNIGGAPEADMAFRNAQKDPGYENDLPGLCRYRTESLSHNIDWLSGFLGPNNEEQRKTTSPLDLMQMRYALAQLEAYRGDMTSSLAQYEATYEYARTNQPAYVPLAGESLAAAYLHTAEMQNGLYTSPGDRCLVPSKASGPLRDAAMADKAIGVYQQLLEQRPGDLEFRWGLNVAYMLEGKYPAGVPAQYLIPPARFASDAKIARFKDVAKPTGLDLLSMAGGIIVDDFDGDGLLDVITSSMNFCEHLHYFHNNGDGTFSDRSEQAGFLNQLGGLNILQADYDNDGCTDLLVLRGGWEFPMRLSLLHNDCHGHFTDVTRAAGLEGPAAQSQTAVWLDIDNDGFLDLYVGNESGPSQLFHNNGDGTFKEIGHSAGVDQQGFTKAVVAADYDNDGYPDLYVSNLNGPNLLYHNNHDLTFTEVGAQAGVDQPTASFAAWFFDYDNDGWPDLFVTSYYMSTEETTKSRLGQPVNAETMKLYRNLGNGKFADVTGKVKLDRVLMPMGGNFGDIDNDGYLDMYMGNGNPSFVAMVPYALLRNDEGRAFQDLTESSGTGELHKGHGVSFADLGNTGSEDILTVVGGALPSDAHRMRVFANPGNGNDWLTLHLIGTKSNRSAIGARIKVTVQNGSKTRSIYRTVGSGGSFGASPLRQHIGLGPSAKDVGIEIEWPASKKDQVFKHVPVNRFLEIRESDTKYSTLNLKTFRLAGTEP